MRILIYGINYSPELTGIGKYTGEMAPFYASQGHEVRVVTAPPYYPEWRIDRRYRNRYARAVENRVQVIRCPLYVPRRPSAFSRLLHLASFSISSAFPLLSSLFWKPDIVIQIVPTLICSLQTLALAKLSGAKSVIHIQDYEVDAMFGLTLVENKSLHRFALWMERLILKRFDLVSTISERMIERAVEKGVQPDKLILFPNWSDIQRYSDVEKDERLLSELGIDFKKKNVLYSGNLGEKQGLEVVIEAARSMKSVKEIHFLIVGDGAAKAVLEKLTKIYSLENVTFLPLQSSERFPKLLASVDCHLVVQKYGVADAVLPSKLTNILAIGGNAVITAEKGTALGTLFASHEGIAVLVEPESVSALQEGILRALQMQLPNDVAKQYARDHLDMRVILRRYLADIV